MVFKQKSTAIFIIVVLSVFAAGNFLQIPRAVKSGPVYSFPMKFGQWKGIELQYDHKLLTSWLGTDNILFRRYENTAKGYAITLYVAYYSNLDSSDMAHAPEVCYPGQGWEVTSNDDISLALFGRKARIKRMSIEKGSDREVVYSWWETRNKIIPYNSWYHLLQLINKLSFQDTSSLWVRISAETSDDKGKNSRGEAMARLFCNDVAPLLANYFQ